MPDGVREDLHYPSSLLGSKQGLSTSNHPLLLSWIWCSDICGNLPTNEKQADSFRSNRNLAAHGSVRVGFSVINPVQFRLRDHP